MTFKEWLFEHRACKDAVAWVGGRTLGQAWEDCEQADWMLWLVVENAGKCGWPSRKQVVLAACLCAETALQYTDDPRAREAIEVTKRWAAGKATLDEVKTAASTAQAALDAAYAARATFYAARAALDVAYAAIYAAEVVWTAWAVVYAALDAIYAAEAVWTVNKTPWTSHKQMCDIIRENLSVGALS